MNKTIKTAAFSVVAAAAALISVPANALLLTYDDIVTAPSPDSDAPWLTGSIIDGDGGVTITLNVHVDNPEFVTRIFFSVDPEAEGLAAASSVNPITTPDLDNGRCNGAAPAGTGPWQLCYSFAPSDHVGSPASVSFFLAGLSESNFVYNDAGWLTVAHIQGIQPDCSSWVGDSNGAGSVLPITEPGTCGGVSVPEPSTISLLGMGLVAMFGAGITNSRRRRRRKLNA